MDRPGKSIPDPKSCVRPDLDACWLGLLHAHPSGILSVRPTYPTIVWPKLCTRPIFHLAQRLPRACFVLTRVVLRDSIRFPQHLPRVCFARPRPDPIPFKLGAAKGILCELDRSNDFWAGSTSFGWFSSLFKWFGRNYVLHI